MNTRPEIVNRRLRTLDSTIAYREGGEPDAPVALFLHGNPTSSYIWRNILPVVAPVAHVIAPDMIGFGQSGKPYIGYRFADHVRYLDAFIDELRIASSYLVAQDWGTALAFHLAARRPDFVRGLVFMEFIRPMTNWDEFHQTHAARETFNKFRTPGEGERMILDDNAFIERVLPGSIMRKLRDEEMDAYRAPFPTAESRRPILALPRELPIMGEPEDVWRTLAAAHQALAVSTYPKLLLFGEPGAVVTPAFAESFAVTLEGCRALNLGPGLHYLQEDQPYSIGHAISGWIAGIETAARAELRAA